MQTSIIDRLFASFDELEKAISRAKDTLLKRGNPSEQILERLNSYDDALLKQRALGLKLCQCVKDGAWEEVHRNVGLINGLSRLIRDDARAILAAYSSTSDSEVTEEEAKYFC